MGPYVIVFHLLTFMRTNYVGRIQDQILNCYSLVLSSINHENLVGPQPRWRVDLNFFNLI